MKAEAVGRELVKPAQVLHDRDASGQQRCVHRARWAAGVVDADRVDADQPRLLLNQQPGLGRGPGNYSTPP